jgi:aspartate beta-hydroxylase
MTAARARAGSGRASTPALLALRLLCTLLASVAASSAAHHRLSEHSSVETGCIGWYRVDALGPVAFRSEPVAEARTDSVLQPHELVCAVQIVIRPAGNWILAIEDLWLPKDHLVGPVLSPQAESGGKQEEIVHYVRTGRHETSYRVAQTWLTSDPANPNAIGMVGRLASITGRLEKAVYHTHRFVMEFGFTEDIGRLILLHRHFNDTGKAEEAIDRAIEQNIWDMREQRPANYDRSVHWAKPWHDVKSEPRLLWAKKLEVVSDLIAAEALALLASPDSDLWMKREAITGMASTGVWHEFALWDNTQRNGTACGRMPGTCEWLATHSEVATLPWGGAKLSVLQPGTYISPHCAGTNKRIRAHLTLRVPSATHMDAGLKVAGETKRWQQGKALVFDDSFEHEVWYRAQAGEPAAIEPRIVLIVDGFSPAMERNDVVAAESKARQMERKMRCPESMSSATCGAWRRAETEALALHGDREL